MTDAGTPPAVLSQHRCPATGPQKVIARVSGEEVHGYALATGAGHVHVVWEMGSGLRNHDVPAEDVFLPSDSLPWAGTPVPLEQLRLQPRRTA